MVQVVNTDIWIPFVFGATKPDALRIALIHQANCFHTMGTGIARDVRSRYPEAFEADKKTPYGLLTKLGTFSDAEVLPNRFICNMYGQYCYGRDKRYTDYEAVYSGLFSIKYWAQDNNINCLLIPHLMGCRNAGGDWQIVRAIIDSHFKDNPTVLICKKP